jgi:hypothetical protein
MNACVNKAMVAKSTWNGNPTRIRHRQWRRCVATELCFDWHAARL